jgi:Domain of unknown function (DUF4272)
LGEEELGAADVAEIVERKERSIALLVREGIPYLESLPAIEPAATVPRRSNQEVALRALALAVVAAKAATHDQEQAQRLIEAYRLDDAFTPKERMFIDNRLPAPRDCTQLTWRIECSWVMLWALGFADALGRPDEQVAPGDVIDIIEARGRDRFVAEANLRPTAELLDAADLLYRYHWAVRDAKLRGSAPLPTLNPDVVVEWHYALNWLIGYNQLEWDEMSTDT